jgi:hypothetical protein
MPDIKKLVYDNIDENALAEYLTAEFGWFFRFEKNGTYNVVMGNNLDIAPDDRPLCFVKCPGINNIPMDFWTEGWTTPTEDGFFQVSETKEKINFAECVERCCKDGDVHSELEEFRQTLLEECLSE